MLGSPGDSFRNLLQVEGARRRGLRVGAAHRSVYEAGRRTHEQERGKPRDAEVLKETGLNLWVN